MAERQPGQMYTGEQMFISVQAQCKEAEPNLKRLDPASLYFNDIARINAAIRIAASFNLPSIGKGNRNGNVMLVV